ncbi:hypothetical protein CAQ69_18730 [Stutzerimonas stutzeri]|nr:hypothetical protein CAQ69_18730 [Stutzerimonas stutzeri]
MLEFNARTIETITNALRRCDRKVNLTKTWYCLHQSYGIGTPSSSGASLKLSEQDHSTLRALIQRHTSFDPLKQTTAELKGDRMELALKTRNEKLSSQTVSAGIVMVGSPTHALTLASGTYQLPPGSTLNVPAEELHGTHRVVLIENLPVMYHLARYRWPQDIVEIPMLFRGSPQFTPAAVTKALAGVHEVVCFADYDPQGLMNCLTQRRACAMVLPTDEAILRITSTGLDKPADFANQQAAREWLNTLQLPPVQRMLAQKLAISQESMAGSELILYQLERRDADPHTVPSAADFWG